MCVIGFNNNFQLLMDIALIQKDIIKIKGKHSAVIVGVPDTEQLKTKTPADAVLLLKRTGSFDSSKVEGSRLIIKGPGEYEISGVKISAISAENDLSFDIEIDGLNMFLGSISGLKKIKDKLKEENIAVVYSDLENDSSVITTLTPRVVVFYGERAEESIKTLGKTVNPVSKYSTTPEKLPAEMEIVQLG